MRAWIAVLGAVLVVLGAVLWVVPVTPASSSILVPYGDGYDFGLPSGVLIGSVPYSADWSAPVSANVTLYSCGTDSGCPNYSFDPVVAQGHGASGSMSWSSSAGRYFLLVPNVTANITVHYTEPVAGGLAGVGLLGVGVIVCVAGIAIRKPPQEAPAVVPSPPSGPSTPP
ncbi:MAG: hypothetical protein L3K16_01495 [Thermoplasmata archaeon]|nr:hypothetical protein [Thermoplasmata archaeon]